MLFYKVRPFFLNNRNKKFKIYMVNTLNFNILQNKSLTAVVFERI